MTKQTIYSILAIAFILLFIRVHYAYGTNTPTEEEKPVDVANIEPQEVLEPKDYAKQQIIKQFGENHWESFNKIIQHESEWNYSAKNPKSSARGLCQTMMSLHEVDDDFLSNPYKQIDWCINYAKDRYSNPILAWNFWQENRWW